MTVRRVLEHTSGLPNWADGPLRFDFAPGEHWQYSGEGYLLLQRAVEAVTGQTIDRVVAEHVFEPLGMTHSAFVWDDGLASRLVPGDPADPHAATAHRFTTPIVSTTLYTTAGDYGRFIAALLRDRRALALTVASPVPMDPRLGLSWGLGWGIEGEGADTTIWHWGDTAGYRAFAMASPATGDGIVVLTNGDKGLDVARDAVAVALPGAHRAFDFRMVR